VRDYVLASPETARFLDLAAELLGFCWPRFEQEGKAYLTVAIGAPAAGTGRWPSRRRSPPGSELPTRAWRSCTGT
jgi:hypothetical protein